MRILLLTILPRYPRCVGSRFHLRLSAILRKSTMRRSPNKTRGTSPQSRRPERTPGEGPFRRTYAVGGRPWILPRLRLPIPRSKMTLRQQILRHWGSP